MALGPWSSTQVWLVLETLLAQALALFRKWESQAMVL